MEIFDVLRIQKTQLIETKDIVSEFSKRLEEKSIINSGSKNFDKVLGGGFKKSQIYLIFGQNRTGKTQLCHQLCIQAFKLFSEESNKFNILYLDSENTFRPERINQLCKSQGLDSDAILKSIKVSNIMSNSALLLVLNKLQKKLEESSQNFVIIDSINNHYRSEQGDPNFKYKRVKNDFILILKKN